VEGQTEPEAVEFRAHVQPLVDEARGRRSLEGPERADHQAWLDDWMRRKGAVVEGVLRTIRGTQQDIDHKGRLDRFRRDRRE
jgi:hypothetical protein